MNQAGIGHGWIQLNIAFCHYYSLSFGGGGERFLVENSRWLTKRGHTVSILSIPLRRGHWRPWIRDLDYREGPIHFFNADVTYYMYNPVLTRFFRHKGPRIAGVHSPMLTQSLSGPAYSRGTFREDVRRHGIAAALSKRSARFLQPGGLSAFDAVDWNSPLDPAELYHHRTYKNPGTVNTRVFRPLGNKRDEFTALFVGRQDYGKGFDRFAEASSLVPEVKFLATGGSASRVIGIGHPQDLELADLYSACSVLVCPSRGDTFGRVLVEALACGTPVITTSLPAHQALRLPFIYADTVPEIVSAVGKLRQMWQGGSGDYLKLAEAGVREVGRYDTEKLLPDFEQMLREVAYSNLRTDRF